MTLLAGIIEDWLAKGIWSIVHLMDDNGNILSYVLYKKKM